MSRGALGQCLGGSFALNRFRRLSSRRPTAVHTMTCFRARDQLGCPLLFLTIRQSLSVVFAALVVLLHVLAS